MACEKSVVVAGHICLDFIPDFGLVPTGKLGDLLQPGHLILVGPAGFMTGGPVSNTGLALHRLGVRTRLVAKIGSDPLGAVVRGIVEARGKELADGLVTDSGSSTSYSVIVSAPGVDRLFIHCPGANDTFSAEDIDFGLVAQSDLFHFGYPPVMRNMYENDGAGLVEVFHRAKDTGVTTSLDMTFPDPTSDGGKADWVTILAKTLPYVDVFLPSFEELVFMLRRDLYDDLTRSNPGNELLDAATPELVSSLGSQLMDMGVKVAVIKLGSRGLYLRTSHEKTIRKMGRAAPPDATAWADRELWAACFKVKVIGTTGSGDSTIAGFLGALLCGLLPYEAVTAAVAVGACNVEASDALSGLISWEETLARVARGWDHLPMKINDLEWKQVTDGLWERSI